jgi:hypothetical protein
MAWHPYDLDHLALEIVLKARKLDPDSLNQAYKMRAACAYGLERFWGEHLRLADKEPQKAQFVADVWTGFVGIMAKAGVSLPAAMLSNQESEAAIQSVAEQLWRMKPKEQQAPLAVLTALCDAVVWWTQRLKPGKGGID